MKKTLSVRRVLLALVPCLTMSFTAQATLANRVFVSARSGNDANSCDNVNTPCQTFAGAVTQLNPDGEAIVLDSGGYGAVTITQGVTIEVPAGVTAFIHPASGDAITVSAGSSDKVTLRGLTLNVGSGNGITITSVGTLNVENCFIAGFAAGSGIAMNAGGRLNVKGTDVTGCTYGIYLANVAGTARASIDRCHLDGNVNTGFKSSTTAPGGSTTTATNSTANNNSVGWWCGHLNSGKDVLNLESCSGSENSVDGIVLASLNDQSALRYSNCVLVNNNNYGVERNFTSIIESRGNNTITGNGIAPTINASGSFSPM